MLNLLYLWSDIIVIFRKIKTLILFSFKRYFSHSAKSILKSSLTLRRHCNSRPWYHMTVSVLSLILMVLWVGLQCMCDCGISWSYSLTWLRCFTLHKCSCFKKYELPRPIPWNQTADVHRGSTLITRVITWRWRYITWRWRHRNH